MVKAVVRSVGRIGVALGMLVGPFVVYVGVEQWRMIGWIFPLHHVETLRNAVGVSGWTGAGLTLADGRAVAIPNVRNLPAASRALTEFTKRGVEIEAGGKIVCLTRVVHWCGNDPMREDIERVNLSKALVYLGVGEAIIPAVVGPEDLPARDHSEAMWEEGWNVSDFMMFPGREP